MRTIYLSLLLLPLFLSATDIGMVHTLRVNIPGDRLQALPADERSPAVLRVEPVGETAEGYVYEIDFVGLEPGEYDVTQYLRTITGSPPAAEPVRVAVERKLPADFRGEILTQTRRVGFPPAWYTPTAVVVCIVWVACLPLMLLVGRKDNAVSCEAVPVVPSIRERLSSLLDEIGDDEGKEAWQQLEATLIHYLADARHVSAAKAFDRLLALKKDEVAGPAIREFELCLHAPGGRGRESLDRALRECARVLEAKA